MPDSGRRSYDTGASQQVQGDIGSIVGRLEHLIAERNKQVSQAVSDFQADGVSDEYQTVEHRWHRASTEVQQIITLVKTTLMKNDETASSTLGKAKSAVNGIG